MMLPDSLVKRFSASPPRLSISGRASLFPAFLVSLLLLSSCSNSEAIKDNEVGVVVSASGKYTLYRKAEKPFVFPFIEKFHRISTEPVVLSLSGRDGTRIVTGDGEELFVESRITYVIEDVAKAVKKFGASETHRRIEDKIREHTGRLITEHSQGIHPLRDSRQRITMTAEIHVELNNLFSPNGVSIRSFHLRFK